MSKPYKSLLTYGERLRHARKLMRLTQGALGRKAGMSQSSVSELENDVYPTSTYTAQLADALHISALWLAEGRGPMSPDHDVSDNVAIYSVVKDSSVAPEPSEPGDDFMAVRRVRLKVSAGVTGFHVEPLNGDGLPIFFRSDWLKSRHLRADRLLAVRVNGDSMSPGLYDGDLVVINTESTEPKDGEVFVINYEGEAVIKRLKRDGGQWWLSSDNPDKMRYGDKRCDEHAIVIGQVIYKQSEHI